MSTKNRFLLRKEYFGGLVYDRETRSVELLNQWQYDFLRMLGNKKINEMRINQNEKEFVKHLENKQIISNGTFKADSVEVPIIKQGVVSAPLRMYYHITFGCNLLCNHCMIGNKKRGADELTTEEACDMLSQLEDLGNPELRITGGEPTIRPDLFDIIDDAVSRSMNVALNTNGVFNRKIRDRIISSGIDALVISIDGNEKVNDRRRGQGMYDKTLKTIRYFADYNKVAAKKINICLNPTISKENVFLTEYFIDLAIKLGGSESGLEINFMPLRPFGNAAHLTSQMLTTKEWYQFAKTVQRLRDSQKVKESNLRLFSRNMDLFGNYEDCGNLPTPFDRSSCGAATFRMGLSPNGLGNVCGFIGMLDEFKTPSTREASLLEIWHSDGFQKLRHVKKKPCMDCNFYRKECVGVCKAMSYITTGELGESDPYCFVDLI